MPDSWGSWYWSSSTNASDSDEASVLLFHFGYMHNNDKTNYGGYVLLTRQTVIEFYK